MDLDQQLQVLIDNAPQDGVTPHAIAAIAPALKAIASQLQHQDYYIVQTLNQEWVLLTLSRTNQPQVTKTVVYAFPSLQDISLSPSFQAEPNRIAVPFPVTHLLFQLSSITSIDSVIFREIPDDSSSDVELKSSDIQSLLQHHLHHYFSPNIPSDLA
ncbi:MAG: hypothetical protein ACKO3I_03510 [Synechococcales cyanobacterium]|nr:hypothetical protein [Cyanobacteria bacterium REEB444]